MILDKTCEFADAVALNTGAADNYAFGSSIDSSVARDLGNGQPVYLVITVATDLDSSGDGVAIEIQLRSDSTSSVDPDTGTLHLSTGAITQTNWNAIDKIVLALPTEGLAYERYLGLTQVTSVEAATAGALNAFLTCDPHGWQAYPEGDN